MYSVYTYLFIVIIFLVARIIEYPDIDSVTVNATVKIRRYITDDIRCNNFVYLNKCDLCVSQARVVHHTAPLHAA